MELVPTWTKAGSWSLGRDPLGLQATSVRIYRSLVPGLTNVTNRLRYYSFYCWVIERYEALEHSGSDGRWRSFIRRAEALYALACNLADFEHAEGLAGNIWANRLRQEISSGDFDVRPFTDFHDGIEQYLGAKRGNFGQFYIASMIEEHFLARSTGIPIVSDDLGRQAAAAFSTSVGDIGETLLAAIRAGDSTVDELRKIGHAVHPASIPPGSEEMSILRRYLLAEGSDTESGRARRASCWLALDLLAKGLAERDESAMRRALYNKILPQGAAYSPPGRIARRWQAYQANELCHIALEAILNAMMVRLAQLPDGQDPNVLVTQTLAPLVDRLQLDAAAWQDWAARISADNQGREEILCEPVLRSLDDVKLAGDIGALESAITLLGVLWIRWRPAEQDVRDEIDRFAARGDRSLAGLIRTLDELAPLPAMEAILRVIRRHVISSHLAIAGRKLSASGNFTYHFTSADGLLSDGQLARYGYTNPRLRNLVRFLGDARLHDSGKVTKDGLEFLHGCQPV